MAQILDPTEAWPLRRASLVYAQPVALSCGRVLRARTAHEVVDACLRAGEILARYVAAIAISSYAARDDDSVQPLTPLAGNLSFGHFLAVVQQVATLTSPHPAATYIAAGFKPRKNVSLAPTNVALIAILSLRNELGHDLNTLDASKARSVLSKLNLPQVLADALRGVEGLLNLPLFVIEDQQFARKTIRARRLLLMGESSDPTPEEVELAGGVEEPNIPYLAINQKILRLPPALIWEFIEDKANFQLLFVDSLDGPTTKYKTVGADKLINQTSAAGELQRLCAAVKRPAEEVTLIDGRHFAREWTERRNLIEEAAQRGEGLIPWDLLAPVTIKWLAGRLDGEKGKTHPNEVIHEHILDSRTSVNGHERRQLILLLGKPDAVNAELRRDVIALQVQMDRNSRWDERLLVGNSNLLVALNIAVGFIAKHLSGAGLTFDGLADPSGPPDYVAIREALINQFIHQDYSDPSGPAQIAIRPEETVLFNVGHSLVDSKELTKGGRSQSRNPLIARALRLIGFADLGGSGIRVLESAWKRARRRPPVFENNRNENNFTLTLDWRSLPALHDEFWRNRLGATLSASQGKILDLLRISSKTMAELCAELSTTEELVSPDVAYLERQVLILMNGEIYDLMDHIREILE
jgi:hypothetical protein